MIELRPCDACARHVAIDETTCPFCAAALPAVTPRPRLAGRLSRAAVFAGATLAASACGGGKAKPDPGPGPNPATADAGVPADAPAPTPIYREPDHPSPKPYGAPPARRRVV